jgi:hypothetical protein
MRAKIRLVIAFGSQLGEGITHALAAIGPIIGFNRLFLAVGAGRYSMKRMAAITWHGVGISLLLFATAIPDLHCCLPHLFLAGPRQEKEEKDGPCEQQLAQQYMAHVARRHRGDAQRPQLPRLLVSLLSLHPRDASQHGQVCLADGLRGARNLLNGCGAVLLR